MSNIGRELAGAAGIRARRSARSLRAQKLRQRQSRRSQGFQKENDASANIRRALRSIGILISMQLVLREKVSLRREREVTKFLRHMGFMVWRADHVHRALMLAGEPTLSLTFMDAAAQRGLLDPALGTSLEQILRSNGWLRAKNRPTLSRILSMVLPEVQRINAPPGPPRV